MSCWPCAVARRPPFLHGLRAIRRQKFRRRRRDRDRSGDRRKRGGKSRAGRPHTPCLETGRVRGRHAPAGYPPSVTRAVVNQLLSDRFASRQPGANEPFWKQMANTPESVEACNALSKESQALFESLLGEERFYSYLETSDGNYANIAQTLGKYAPANPATSYQVYQMQAEIQVLLAQLHTMMESYNAQLEQLVGAEAAAAYRKEGPRRIFPPSGRIPRPRKARGPAAWYFAPPGRIGARSFSLIAVGAQSCCAQRGPYHGRGRSKTAPLRAMSNSDRL